MAATPTADTAGLHDRRCTPRGLRRGLGARQTPCVHTGNPALMTVTIDVSDLHSVRAAARRARRAPQPRYPLTAGDPDAYAVALAALHDLNAPLTITGATALAHGTATDRTQYLVSVRARYDRRDALIAAAGHPPTGDDVHALGDALRTLLTDACPDGATVTAVGLVA